MKALIKLFYWLRKLWFTLRPRQVGQKGYIPTPKPTLGTVGALPAAPTTWKAPRLKWGMLGNDRLGDCVYAAIAHAIMGVAKHANKVLTFAEKAVVNGYLSWTGGADAGVYIDSLLQKWQQDKQSNTSPAPFGVGGPFVRLDPTNIDQIKSAIATFGWVIVGSQLQQAQEMQFAKGQQWDYVPGSPVVGGHGVCFLGYNATGPFTVTWGRGVRATWNWVTNTCDEAYTGILPPHIRANGFSPATIADLTAYCNQLPSA